MDVYTRIMTYTGHFMIRTFVFCGDLVQSEYLACLIMDQSAIHVYDDKGNIFNAFSEPVSLS